MSSLVRIGISCMVLVATATWSVPARAEQGLQIPPKLTAALAQAYVAVQVRTGSARADAWTDGSPGSVALLNAYHADDFTALVDVLTRKCTA